MFGGPTSLPWALEIDEAHRPTRFLDEPTFHPTFLYELLWNLFVVAAIIWIVPRLLPRLRRGYLFAAYVLLYTIGRLWIELVRVDEATEILGIRVNVFTSVILGSAAAFMLWRGTRTVAPAREPDELEVSVDANP